MAQQIVRNYTVIDEDTRGNQIGWRNFFNSRGEELVELRLSGSDVAQVPLSDFKKLILAGEALTELMVNGEIADENAEN